MKQDHPIPSMPDPNREAPRALIGTVIAVLLDGLMVVGYLYGVPLLVERFQVPSWFNGVLLAGAFVLLLNAIYAIRELDSGPGGKATLVSFKQRGCVLSLLLLLSFYFIVFCTAIFLIVTPIGMKPGVLMGALTTGVVTVIIAFRMQTRGTVEVASMAGLGLQTAAVVGVNVITLVMLAVWQSPGFDLRPDPGVPLLNRVISFVLGYLLALAFYAPPRLLLAFATGTRTSLISFALSLAYFVWDMFVRTAS